MRINIRLTLAFLLIGLVPLLTISILAFSAAKGALKDEALDHLYSVAVIQKARIESVIDKYLERLAIVSSNTELRTTLCQVYNPVSNKHTALGDAVPDLHPPATLTLIT